MDVEVLLFETLDIYHNPRLIRLGRSFLFINFVAVYSMPRGHRFKVWLIHHESQALTSIVGVSSFIMSKSTRLFEMLCDFIDINYIPPTLLLSSANQMKPKMTKRFCFSRSNWFSKGFVLSNLIEHNQLIISWLNSLRRCGFLI